MRLTLKDIGEIAGGVIVLALWALVAWLFIAATPSQMSAECELAAEAMQSSR